MDIRERVRRAAEGRDRYEMRDLMRDRGDRYVLRDYMRHEGRTELTPSERDFVEREIRDAEVEEEEI